MYPNLPTGETAPYCYDELCASTGTDWYSYTADCKISAGLSLIGAIVAEFVTGIGGSSSGLAYTIIESSYRLEIPKMFAALILIALTGVVIFFFSSLLSKIFLHRWHESEQNYEN